MISRIPDDMAAPSAHRMLAPILIASFVAIAVWLVRDAIGVPSIIWAMNPMTANWMRRSKQHRSDW